MKSLLIAVVVSFLVSGSSAFADSGRQKVILSYFEAFANDHTNQSQLVANLVKANLASDPNIDLVLCPGDQGAGLKVGFYSTRNDLQIDKRIGSLLGNESAYQQLVRCYEANPDAKQVISLAQGICDINVAGSAYNAMFTGGKKHAEDNNGNKIKKVQKIELSLPDFLQTDDLNILTKCALPEHNLINYSDDISDYVCNNLLFNFQNKIKQERLPVTYSMIHVPLDLNEFNKNQCDSKPFKTALKEQGLKLDDPNLLKLVSDQVTDFIQTRNKLATQYSVGSDPSQITSDLLFKASDLNTPAMHSCTNHLRAFNAGAQNIYNSKYRQRD